MINKRFTHAGTVRGSDSRTPEGYHYHVALRETKRFWVTSGGTKFRKSGGHGIGDWPMYRLDINSIKERASK